MKTSLLALFTTMLATAAFAAPLPGNALAAAAGAAAALNHTQRLELTVTPAPQIVPAIPAAVAAPAPVRAVRAR